MALHLQFRQEPENYPIKIRLIGEFSGSTINISKDYAQKYGLTVSEPEKNNNVLKPDACTLFVVDEFENNPVLDDLETTSDAWILGPTALVELNLDPTINIRGKPTYCYSMYGLCFYINCRGNVTTMRRMVKLIKWMGGHFVRSPNSHVTHMITTSTRAKGYLYCWTFNVPIMTPAWVEYCWLNRLSVGFKATTCMHNFKVAAFEDLYICFKGFPNDEYQENCKLTHLNGGVVVNWTDQRCTHMVVHADISEQINMADIPAYILHVVKAKWFWMSIQCRQRFNEDSYKCFSLKTIEQVKWAEEVHSRENYSEEDSQQRGRKESLSLKTRSSSVRLSSRSSSGKKDEHVQNSNTLQRQDLKRKYAFEELCQTEKNYLQCLGHLLKIQHRATDPFYNGGSVISQTEAKIIFMNLKEILKIHRKICIELKNILCNWKNDIQTAQIFVTLKDEIKKEYLIYAGNFEESQKTLHKCMKENPRFQALLGLSRDIIKEHPKDLFIRPIQRFCSVTLLLSEINKNTREDNPDKESLVEAIRVIKDLLQTMNRDKENIQKLKCVFDIHRLIEGCPPDLITSNREFVGQFIAQEIKDKENCLGPQLKFFLFTDILVITKVRSRSHDNLAHCNNLDGPFTEKPYKHIATIPLSMILQILHFEGDKNMFGFIVRSENEENETVINGFMYLDQTFKFKDTLLMIANQISQRDYSKSSEDYIVENIPPGRVSIQPVYYSPIKKNIFKQALNFVKNIRKSPIKSKKKRSFSCSDLEKLNFIL